MFSALKSFFLTQSNPPVVIKKFFENSFSEIYYGTFSPLYVSNKCEGTAERRNINN
jgi:hypothetical protein